jgi:hypothetical protein
MKSDINLAYFSTTQLMIELIDSLKGTPLYKQAEKNMCNRLQDHFKKNLELLFKEIKDEDTERAYYESVRVIECFVRCLRKKDIREMHGLLEAYENDEVVITD